MYSTKYKPFIFFVLAFILLAKSAYSQDMKRVKNTVKTLASEKFHGRGYIAHGDSLAAHFIAQRFAAMGIAPLVPNNYFQYFTLDINTFPDKIRLQVGRKNLRIGHDFIMHEGASSSKKKQKLLLQRLDTNIFSSATMQAYWQTQTLENKALWFSNTDSKKMARLPLVLQEKLKTAGAWIETFPDKLTASLSKKQDRPPHFKVKRQRFDSTAQQVIIEVNAQLKTNYRSQNVVAVVRGSVQPDSFLLVSAHYDHLGRMGKKALFAGANDNASGTSFMLELADYFAKKPHKYSVVFVAFGGEEAGLIGSKFFTENSPVALEKIKLVLNLDLLGTGDDGLMVVNGAVFPKLFDQIKHLNDTNKYLPQIRARGKAANSDHYWFSEKGVPALFVYTMGGISAYHDIYDVPKTLPYTRFRETFALLTQFLEGL